MSKKTIYAVIAIIGLYIASQLIADVGATYFVEWGNLAFPGGTFVFAITFTLRDMIHKRLGKTWAQGAIIVAALMNIFLSLYLLMISRMAYPVFYNYGEAWKNIFSVVPAITFGSIVAELVSELVDTEVYHFWWKRFPKFPQWTRVLVSNVVSIPVDTLIFTVLAFMVFPFFFGGELLTFWDAAARLVNGQMVYKIAVSFISMPLIYMVKEKSILQD